MSDFHLEFGIDDLDENTNTQITALANEIGVPFDYVRMGLIAQGNVAGKQLQAFSTVSELRAGIIANPGTAITGKLLALLFASDSKTVKLDGVTYDEKGLAALDKKVMDWAVANGLQQKKGCYIATAVYGAYDCPEVWVLRRYRDNSLATHTLGRGFIKAYYTISPALVTKFGHIAWLNRMVKAGLDRIVASLRANGISDAAYHD